MKIFLEFGVFLDYKDSYGFILLYYIVIVGGDFYCCEFFLYEYVIVCCKDENGWYEIY